MNSNVINKSNTNLMAASVLKELNDYLSKSLGPFGSNTLIQGRQLDHHLTKDGFTILKAIHFNSPVAATFLSIIRDGSEALVEEVGDGSTSAIMAAYQLYVKLSPLLIDSSVRPKLLLDTLKELVEKIIYELGEYTTVLDSKDVETIKNIAAISLNNDSQVGALIAEIYSNIGLEGFVNVKRSNTNSTSYNRTDGFQIDVGFFDKIFANDGPESVLENSAILMFDSTLSDKETVVLFDDYLSAHINGNDKIKSLTIIAPGYDNNSKSIIAKMNNFYQQKGFKMNYNFIEYVMRDEMDGDIFFDLSAMVGADIVKNSIDTVIFDKDTVSNYVGFAKKVISNKKNTTFFETNENTEILDIRKSEIKIILDEMRDQNIINPKESYVLKKRLAIMNKNLVTINVGGNSEQERLANKDLVDDAVAACKSAFKYGYVIGGNLSIVLASERVITELRSHPEVSALKVDLTKAIRDAFIQVYKEVLNKSDNSLEEIENIIDESIAKEAIYDLVKEEYTKTTVINSVKTEIEILKNVVSIISLILTCNQFVEVNTNTIIE